MPHIAYTRPPLPTILSLHLHLLASYCYNQIFGVSQCLVWVQLIFWLRLLI